MPLRLGEDGYISLKPLLRKKGHARNRVFTTTKHRMPVRPAVYLGTIFRRDIRRTGSKRSLKVPLDFPGSDRLRPASQYFSNFLSKSYGTRSIMTSREQSSLSLSLSLSALLLSRILLVPATFFLYSELHPSPFLYRRGKARDVGVNNHSG